MLHEETAFKAESIWSLEVLINSYCCRSFARKGELISSMFPDSENAKVSNGRN